jgi:hypothetical protein
MNRHKSLFKDNTESSKEAALQTFLRQNVQAGMCAVDRVARDIPEDTNEEDRSILLQQTLMEGTASAIARNASTLPASSRQLLQQKFGTSTTVKLPNGQVIDTTALGANIMNLHTNNNRLGVARTTVGQYLPGMKNHQEPLFVTVTDEYKRASENIPIADAFLGPIMHDILSTNDPSVPRASVPRAASAAAASLPGASASYAAAASLHAAAASINHCARLKKMQPMRGVCNLCMKLIQTVSLMLIKRQWMKESQLPSQTLQSILWIVILELHHLPLVKSTIQSTLTRQYLPHCWEMLHL